MRKDDTIREGASVRMKVVNEQGMDNNASSRPIWKHGFIHYTLFFLVVFSIPFVAVLFLLSWWDSNKKSARTRKTCSVA